MISQPDGYVLEADVDALVLLSGGQDSTTCLGWAKEMYRNVGAVSFDYEQRHGVELDAAHVIAAKLGVSHVELHVPALKSIGAAALTNPDIDVDADAAGTGNVYAEQHDLPSTFVPARNAILLATAAAYAAPNGFTHLVTGVCETDEAGYPDCRASFVEAQEAALRLALDDPEFTIAAPLLHLDKADTFALAEQVGVLELVVDYSHTCYHGEHKDKHDWGYGCAECPACEIRAAGWDRYRAGATA